MKLFAAPAGRISAWIGAQELSGVVTLLNRLQSACGPRLSAFEMMSESSLSLVTSHLDAHVSPLEKNYPYYALVKAGKAADHLVRNGFPEFPIINFGHIGDGNLHFNVLVPLDISASSYKEITAELNKQIHDLVTQFNGSITVEHGVGTLQIMNLGKLL